MDDLLVLFTRSAHVIRLITFVINQKGMTDKLTEKRRDYQILIKGFS